MWSDMEALFELPLICVSAGWAFSWLCRLACASCKATVSGSAGLERANARRVAAVSRGSAPRRDSCANINEAGRRVEGPCETQAGGSVAVVTVLAHVLLCLASTLVPRLDMASVWFAMRLEWDWWAPLLGDPAVERGMETLCVSASLALGMGLRLASWLGCGMTLAGRAT